MDWPGLIFLCALLSYVFALPLLATVFVLWLDARLEVSLPDQREP